MWASFRMLFVFLVLGIPAAVVGIPWTMLRGNARTMNNWAMGTIRLGLRFGGVHVRLLGTENFPAQACIVMSNHVSNLDPPVLLPSIPGVPSVMLKKTLMNIPLLGAAMRLGKYVPVSRGNSRDEAIRSVAAAADALASGQNIVVFPEGTRSPDGSLLPFRKGGFFLAVETNAPILPTVIRGTSAMMSRDTLKVKPGTATVQFLPPRFPQDFASREDLMLAVRQDMEAALAP